MEALELTWKLGAHRLPRLGLRYGATPSEGLLIQSVLPGQEYGLDVVNDLKGNYCATFVKRKLSMRAGETDRAVTETHPQLAEVGKRIGELLGHRGNLDCDVFYDGKQAYLLELNPRFGGGFPFTAEAGADMLSALIAWVCDEEPPRAWASMRPGVTCSKYDRLVQVSAQRKTSDAQSEAIPLDSAIKEPALLPLAGVFGLKAF